MKQLITLVVFCAIYGICGWIVGEEYGERIGADKILTYQKNNPPPIPLMTTRHAPLVMRDARVICLSAILQRVEPADWKEMTKAMAMSPNVCRVAEFLYPKDEIPEHSPDAESQAAAQAIDNG